MELGSAPYLRTPHPGPATSAVLERMRRLEPAPGLTFGIADDPPVLARAFGAVIEDPDGNRFLDMAAGFGSLNLGHSHPDVVAAVTSQMALGQQAMSIAATARIDLLERLAGAAPGYRILLGTSGAESAETALKLARRATGRHGVVAFTGAFHGRTMGVLGLMGRRTQRTGLGPMPPGIRHLPFPDPYRSPLGGSASAVGAATLELLDHLLADPAGGWDDVGVVIIEPVQGNGGMIPVPDGFLAGLRAVCSTHDVLLIVDEVMSGFHRTGCLFAFQHDEDVRPDMVILGKSISAGLPLSACLVTADVAASSPAGVETSTYAGNLVSCAAALAALDVYERDRLSLHAARLGDVLLDRLREDLAGIACVGVIRGRGLMVAVELVADTETKEPLAIARRVSGEAVRRGVLLYPGGHHGNVVSMLPPLIITEEQAASASTVLAETLADLITEGAAAR